MSDTEAGDITLSFISDPGHGWLMVTESLMREVGLTEDDISPYSYRNGTLIALEEDCDAAVFMRAWENLYGQKVKFRERHQDPTDIRNWDRYGRKK